MNLSLTDPPLSHPSQSAAREARLPSELQDMVIDCIPVESSESRDTTAPWAFPSHAQALEESIRTLSACTLVSRNWRDRAERPLYRRIVLRTATAMRRFVTLVLPQPRLVALIQEISFGRPKLEHGCWPFQQLVRDLPQFPFPVFLSDRPDKSLSLGILMRIGEPSPDCPAPPLVILPLEDPPLKRLSMYNLRWEHEALTGTARPAFCRTVTHLSLTTVLFATPAHLLSFIHSCDSLVALTLDAVKFDKEYSSERVAATRELLEDKGSWAPPQLRHLTLHTVDSDHGRSLCYDLIGDNIEELVSDLPQSARTLVLECLPHYGRLRSLVLRLHPWSGGITQLHRLLLWTLGQVRSTELRSLHLYLPPDVVPAAPLQSADHPRPDFRASYWGPRDRLLDGLFHPEFCRKLRQLPIVAHLHEFRFIVVENSRDPEHDERAWHSELARQLEGVSPEIIHVEIMYYDGSSGASEYDFTHLWDDPQDTSESSTEHHARSPWNSMPARARFGP